MHLDVNSLQKVITNAWEDVCGTQKVMWHAGHVQLRDIHRESGAPACPRPERNQEGSVRT
eukprot:792252-Rhodomonas_salina.2